MEEGTPLHGATPATKPANKRHYETFRKGIENSDPAISANVMIGLIKLTNYLLDQQIRHLERAFLEEGGLRERMTRARLTERAKQNKRRL